jgi:hypothetical protein
LQEESSKLEEYELTKKNKTKKEDDKPVEEKSTLHSKWSVVLYQYSLVSSLKGCCIFQLKMLMTTKDVLTFTFRKILASTSKLMSLLRDAFYQNDTSIHGKSTSFSAQRNNNNCNSSNIWIKLNLICFGHDIRHKLFMMYKD